MARLLIGFLTGLVTGLNLAANYLTLGRWLP